MSNLDYFGLISCWKHGSRSDSFILDKALSACDKYAEDIGEAIDDAASDVADEAKDAVDAVKEKLDE